MMAFLRILLLSFLVLYFSNNCYGKIVLPQKLRYLENMLNSDVAKAAKRQHMEGTPNEQDRELGWPSLGQYQAEYKNNINSIPDNKFERKNILNRRRLPIF